MTDQAIYASGASRDTFFQSTRKRAMGLLAKMGSINLNTGAVNLSNIIAAVAVAALLWFGSTMTKDHDQIIEILAGQTSLLQSMDGMKTQLTDVKTLVLGMQHEIDENRARLDCLQHVGTTAGCPVERHR
jgi:hypothetical protein